MINKCFLHFNQALPSVKAALTKNMRPWFQMWRMLARAEHEFQKGPNNKDMIKAGPELVLPITCHFLNFIL